MSALPTLADQYVVSHGKSGGLGCFLAPAPLPLRRGARVVLETVRGLEVGVVLCPASIRQARLLGATSTGKLLRPVGADDENAVHDQGERGRRIFELTRTLAGRLALPLEILDVEVLLDGSAIIQMLGSADIDPAPLGQAVFDACQTPVRFENLAVSAPSIKEPEEDEAGGCGKPDCGKAGGDGGCSSCGTGGGCSTGSCGTGGAGVDMREYFAHLRTRMDDTARVSLL